ncbi:N-6 DNA methylase [Pantoea sp. V106_11]|uniref:N-6 DNA methylase n=1 Tax=Pantoea sp. V106_11 TaxID=3044234 RepID=UPI00249DBF3D|nr:N-6 DNA methylase [Pantoea sp. V106_11]MDI3414794.1 N-6 DNA methylase [Pantoea sp. V106_11]
MIGLNEYNLKLKFIFERYKNQDVNYIDQELSVLLSAQEYLRSNESITSLRKNGVFFTGDELAFECLNFLDINSDNFSVLDPACGVGNLLVCVTKKLNVYGSLSDTLHNWNGFLHGFDLHQNFIEATQIRIVLEAIKRGAFFDGHCLEHYTKILKNIKCYDSLKNDYDMSVYTHILMNPPYNQEVLAEYNHWKGGKVNLAAVFVDKFMTQCKQGTQIVAILPDVLRTGTRYEKWRNAVEKSLRAEIYIKGRFDKKTNVDVFIINGKVNSNNSIAWSKIYDNNEIKRISNYFKVSVGKVVPYRDKYEGESNKYIYPRSVIPWSTIDSSEIKDLRMHKSLAIKPPFLIVKRTSSPKDKFRASSQVITGKESVYIENHLLVVEPISGKVQDCTELLSFLKSDFVNSYLNETIRCRHLTVKSLSTIPFELGKENEKTN